MSPTGIPIFYAAEEAETAESEARAAETVSERNTVTLGLFEATRDLRLVDLCAIPAPSGLFDEARAHLRPILRFLAEFAQEASGPVRRDGREHPEYVPTQVFAEWLRFEFSADGKRIDGIRYRSAQADGVCIALFIGPGSAAESDEDPTAEQVLRHTNTIRSNGD
jgi:hypothetical protein